MDCRLMTVMDQGETLEVRFGPIPLFRKTVQYADIVSVELVGQYYSTAGEFT